ncbi:MAG: hypothetical protein EPN17_11440 [Methylobacter sp.]|nr:MAG: hypothetical protein EPN17_11440 [Methylobacter sp.]
MPKKPKENTIRDLQHRAEEFVEDELSFFESERMPQELREQFMEYVEAYEAAEWTTSFELLVRGGMELPAPEQLDDSQLSAKLWEVIRGMAMLRMFLYCTDHLSDRELYEELWHQVLRDETPDLPTNEDSACHIDLVSSGSEEDIELYLRYYADEETRRDWAKDWPNDVIPAHEAPPYDRDRHLPARDQAEWRNCGKPS